jgi:sulfite exporter TauE/SafE
MSTMLLLSAFLMGLLGSTHCVLMCGGVVAMTCSALPPARRGKLLGQLPHVLAYNGGRIASYAAGGAIAGAAGATFASVVSLQHAMLTLRFLAGGMMLAMGIYLAGFGGVLRWAERAGEPVWRRIAPLARRLVPVRTPLHAFALGLAWGWMPCGLVYAALAASIAAGSVAGGALTMVAFGLGTLPTLVAMGSMTALLARASRSARVRTAAAVMVGCFGVLQISNAGMAWGAAGHGGHSCCPAHRH